MGTFPINETVTSNLETAFEMLGDQTTIRKKGEYDPIQTDPTYTEHEVDIIWTEEKTMKKEESESEGRVQAFKLGCAILRADQGIDIRYGDLIFSRTNVYSDIIEIDTISVDDIGDLYYEIK